MCTHEHKNKNAIKYHTKQYLQILNLEHALHVVSGRPICFQQHVKGNAVVLLLYYTCIFQRPVLHIPVICLLKKRYIIRYYYIIKNNIDISQNPQNLNYSCLFVFLTNNLSTHFQNILAQKNYDLKRN